MNITEIQPQGHLVAVHAHPDDETLFTGGIIARWSAAGLPVTVVTCTRGELGESIPEDLADLPQSPHTFGRYRATELREALLTLTASSSITHFFLDELPLPTAQNLDASAQFTDSGMQWAGEGLPGVSGQATAAPNAPATALTRGDLDEQAQRLLLLLRETSPSFIVTYEPGGGYGHPDHVRAVDIVQRARAIDGASPDASLMQTQFLASVLPEEVSRWGRAQLAHYPHAEEAHLPDPFGPLPSISAHQPQQIFTVSTGSLIRPLLTALATYRTQVHWVSSAPEPHPTLSWHHHDVKLRGWYALSNNILSPLFDCETYADLGQLSADLQTRQVAFPL
ncbi:PIG-L family deacetylase [Jonesia quinghaiensis]|uniref:PIG-L family deacetylase n=1 Tax=Jonesia quinghaiensis TaxID=262806 RepID=UPI0012FACE1A|nr:PIG-L family deacetylase [Jonesia quinghaiensis]